MDVICIGNERIFATLLPRLSVLSIPNVMFHVTGMLLRQELASPDDSFVTQPCAQASVLGLIFLTLGIYFLALILCCISSIKGTDNDTFYWYQSFVNHVCIILGDCRLVPFVSCTAAITVTFSIMLYRTGT